MSQEVAVSDNVVASRFELTLDGSPAGFLTYELRPGAIALLHTEVDPAFEGRGLGTTLIRGALESARQRGLRVLPYCPFVKAHLEKHPEENG